jgi:hypothetical protein
MAASVAATPGRKLAPPQAADPPPYLSKRGFADSNLCKLEFDVAAMMYDLGAELDQLLPECLQ